MTEHKPFKTKPIRSIGESEATQRTVYSFQARRDEVMKNKLKTPYIRMMLRIWKKNNVKNKFTDYLQQKRHKETMRSLLLNI